MKDPAFLFYSSDYYVGTRLMSPEERACYIDLLIYQHQNEYIPNNLSKIIGFCTGISEATLEATLEAKFKLCDKGYYNEVLKRVMNERSEFTQKQSENGILGQFFKKAKQVLKSKKYNELRSYIFVKYGKENLISELKKDEATHEAMLEALLKHLEDVNVIEDVIVDKEENKEKIHVSEFVKLTQEEVNKFKDEFGEQAFTWMVTKLDNYIGSNPSKNNRYKDHNRVLRGWVLESWNEKGTKVKTDDKKGSQISAIERHLETIRIVRPDYENDPEYLHELDRINKLKAG